MDREDKDRNRAFYDTERDEDRKRFEEHPSKVFLTENLVPWVIANVEAGARIVDIAGGSGVYASRIVRTAPVTVVGLDISESMISQRAEDPLLTDNIVGDMESLPFADGEFDAALFVGALHHVPNPLPALKEAHRVVRAGGSLFAAEPCSLRVGQAGIRTVPGHAHEFRFSMRYLTDRMQDAGFAVESVRGKRLTLRFAQAVLPDPSIGITRAADRLDRVLTRIPGVARFSELALIHARRVEPPSLDSAR